MDAAACFGASYAQARRLFLDAARRAGLEAEGRRHPQPGAEGEELFMDVVREGDPDAPALLVVTSGCHGVEGFGGSGVQVAALDDAALRALARRRGVAVLHVHALNPHGFSHLRRVTHENVDLNRNFPDFSRPLPANPTYRELHPLLAPERWPPPPGQDAALMAWIGRHGIPAFQQATSSGQYEVPEGLFYGGQAPTWSHLAFREVLRVHGRRAARIGWVDLHTGLGPPGAGERIYSGPPDAQAVARARAWWEHDGARVTSIYDGSSSSALLTGMLWSCAPEECPQAQFTGLVLEFGTVPLEQVLGAMRADQWLLRHPGAPAPLAAGIRRAMRDAFYVDTPDWKAQVVAQGRRVLRQAVEGLAA